MPTNPNIVLALDVGAKRVGLALASLDSRLPQPYKTLDREKNFIQNLRDIVETEGVSVIVIGLPRGLDGQHTRQTADAEEFSRELESSLDLPLYFQDEAVTSRQAEAELDSRGKPYTKPDIDALAATYILEDWLSEHREKVA